MQQVAGITQLSVEGEPLEEYVKDRNFVCTFFSPYYDLCEEGTTTPKWCSNNSSLIFCPDDAGGSSGGGGAGRTWDTKMCFDNNYNSIPCKNNEKRMDYMHFFKDTNTLMIKDQTWDSSLDSQEEFKLGSLSDQHISCVDRAGIYISCDYKLPNGSFPAKWDSSINALGDWRAFADGCYQKPALKSGLKVPCMFNVYSSDYAELSLNKTSIDYDFKLVDYNTGYPVTNENFEGGYPVYVEPPPPPPDPYEVEVPVGNEECGAICVWLSYIYNVMTVVNESVLKVDLSIQEMVSKMTPQELPINSVLLEKLNEILVAIDKISFEMVKEAETNFWDVLGGAFGDIFDFVEFLIEKIIYLVIPEDTTSIMNSFDFLTQDLKDKIKPIHDLQQNIMGSVDIEEKEFQNISITLPQYGEVPFYKVDYLQQAIPYIRNIMGGMMMLMTAIWAYRKVSSEMVK